MMGPSGQSFQVHHIETETVPLRGPLRFSVGPNLTFRIVPMGPEWKRGPGRPGEKEGPVAVAPMAGGYLLQVWLNDQWNDLEAVHLEDGVPIIIQRGTVSEPLNPVIEIDLEGKVGRPVGPQRDRLSTVVISWIENELEHRVYLPRQTFSDDISRGENRTTPRPGFNVNTQQFLPAYLQQGHAQIEIMGQDVVFSDLGSTRGTWIERQDSEPQSHGILRERVETGSVRKEDLSSLDSIDEQLWDVNPERLLEFPFDRPFRISLQVRNKEWAAAEFKVDGNQLWVRNSSADMWRQVTRNIYWSEDNVPVAGQTELSLGASVTTEAYAVQYDPRTGRVTISNHSVYRLQVEPLSPDSPAGLEEEKRSGLAVDVNGALGMIRWLAINYGGRLTHMKLSDDRGWSSIKDLPKSSNNLDPQADWKKKWDKYLDEHRGNVYRISTLSPHFSSQEPMSGLVDVRVEPVPVVGGEEMIVVSPAAAGLEEAKGVQTPEEIEKELDQIARAFSFGLSNLDPPETEALLKLVGFQGHDKQVTGGPLPQQQTELQRALLHHLERMWTDGPIAQLVGSLKERVGDSRSFVYVQEYYQGILGDLIKDLKVDGEIRSLAKELLDRLTPAAGMEEVGDWIHRLFANLGVTLDPEKIGQLQREGEVVDVYVRGISSRAQLTWTNRSPLEPATQERLSHRIVAVEPGLMSEAAQKMLETQAGVKVQVLSSEQSEMLKQIESFQGNSSPERKALILVRPETAGALHEQLRTKDADWKWNVIIVGIPGELLSAPTAEKINVLLSYLSQLLERADPIGERRTEFLEGAYPLDQQNQTLLLSIRA